jgi:hypothetical protein
VPGLESALNGPLSGRLLTVCFRFGAVEQESWWAWTNSGFRLCGQAKHPVEEDKKMPPSLAGWTALVESIK